MQIHTERITLRKRYPLTISRGTTAASENLVVTVTAGGIPGHGEMAPVSGGDSPEGAGSAEADLKRWAGPLEDCSPWEMQRIEKVLDQQPGGRAARAALDGALYDWQGKRAGVPVYQLFGLDPGAIPATSITVGINPPEVVRERVPEMLARLDARALKVKLGNPEGLEADREMFAAAQESAPRPVAWRVDANGGWTVAGAREMIRWLAGRGVEFVEQPLPRGQEEDLPAVRNGSPLPIYVDESVRIAADIPRLADRVDGINLKLMKCGGLREALRMIHTARAHGLKVMMGCFSESSLAITAAAHLSSLADSLDLDSHLNLLPDPFSGAAFIDGRVVPTDAPGLGVTRVAAG